MLSRTDQRSFTREHVDLSLAAEEAAETLLPLAEKRGVTIESSGDTAPTIGSPALLQQLTTNLVHNAIVHNLPDGGRVWVTTSARPDGVVLTVENTGEQLDAPAASPRSSSRSSVAPNASAPTTQGVGLGLAIVKSIVAGTRRHPHPRRHAPVAGSVSRCSWPQHHRTAEGKSGSDG